MGKFQERLRELRGSSLQDEFSTKIGISRTSLSYYENGSRNLSLELLVDIATLYDVGVDFLLADSERDRD